MNQNKKSKFHTLYLCYFGLREPLVQTQVLPYLRQIVSNELKVSLLTFEPNFREKWSGAEIQVQKKQLASEGIYWYCLPYHKSPSVPATIFDVMNGARFAAKLAKKETVDVFHCRSHVAAMMGAIAKSRRGGKLLFDIRGFFPEEYTDAGNWKEQGGIYKAAKRAEKYLLEKSDGFVILTERAREILFPESRETGFDKRGRPVQVIPCCVDLKKFAVANASLREEIRQKLNLNSRRVIAYVGSFGGWYLTEEMLDFFVVAREQDKSTFALILTQREREKVAVKLKEKGFSKQDFLVASVTPSEIPAFLSASDIALSFIKQCYSKQASSPTKIAEYLASGLPVISNGGIGDLDELIETDRVGALVEDFDHASYLKSLEQISDLQKGNDLAENCKRSASRRFDLIKVGGEKYRSLYRRLLFQKS